MKLYQEEPNLLILFVWQEIELFVLVVISDVFDVINMEHFIEINFLLFFLAIPNTVISWGKNMNFLVIWSAVILRLS